jgi:DNA-directed RNA polymerase specialized sigma subunit
MTIKDSTWQELNIVKIWKYKILSYRQQLEELQAVACSVSAVSTEAGGSGPSSGVGDRTGSYAIKLIVLAQQIEHAQNEMAASMDRLAARIDMIPDERERFILHSRFIGGKKFEDIAQELGCSLRHTFRIYKSAVDDFETSLNVTRSE